MPASPTEERVAPPDSPESGGAKPTLGPVISSGAGTLRERGTTRRERLPGIDVARGLAVVLMLQTHAYDGCVSPQEKTSFGYALSRLLANIPAPLFLLLAGVGLSFGAHAALGRGLTDRQIRRQLALRGLQIVGYGYLVSALYVCLEWPLPVADLAPLLLRADILHCIGWSLALCATLLVRRSHLTLRVVVLVASGLLLAIAVGRFAPQPTGGPLAAFLAPLYDVPRYTRFPLLPLVGFAAVGVWVGQWLLLRPPSGRSWLLWFGTAVVTAACFGWATRTTLQLVGGSLRRSHPAVVWNFGDGCARGIATLALGLGLTEISRADSLALRVLARLGSGSLLAYALHIPFCYGRLARPIAGRLSMASASAYLLALLVAVYVVLWLRDALRQQLRGVPRRGPHSP